MLLSDVIKVIGNEPLSKFPWGCVVIQTVNMFVPAAERISPESTAVEVNKALDSLDTHTRDLVLTANLDAQHCRISAPVGGGMTLEFEGDSPDDANSDVFSHLWNNPLFLVSSSVVTVILVISVVMLSTLSIHKDVDWVELLSQCFSFLIQGFL